MAKTDAERKAAERERRAALGLKRFEIWLHPKDWPLVQRFVEQIRKARSKT